METEQDYSGKAREEAEVWEEAAEEVEWVEIVQVQGQAEIVFALVVAQRHLTKLGHHVVP
ncbi:MAG: hypothetical protein ISS34_00455 [Candidatus Omnitrophica bacterium]|nr:hypothetical protein [Candidatus Omnitrophota bacterium]